MQEAFKSVSVIIPSKRVKMLRDLVNSLGSGDVLVGYDDGEVKDFIDSSWVKGFRVSGNVNEMYNQLAREVSGDYIWALNDDCLVDTEGWEEKIIEAMGEGIKYGACEDESNGMGWFPVLSRGAYEALGDFFDERYGSWSSDQELSMLFSHHLLERKVKVPVKVRHISYHTKTREKDEVNVRVSAMANTPFPYVLEERQRKLLTAVRNEV